MKITLKKSFVAETLTFGRNTKQAYRKMAPHLHVKLVRVYEKHTACKELITQKKYRLYHSHTL